MGNYDLSVVIGLSKARKDSSFVYCFKLNRRGLITGFPFRLMNKKEKRPWKNKQIRKKRITLGSLIFCKRKPHGHSFKYIKSANKVWDMGEIFHQLGLVGCEAAVYQGITKCFPVKIKGSRMYRDDKDGPSPACALISVKEATLVDGKIKFKTLLGEEFALENMCQNERGSCVKEVPLPVQDSCSNEGISNYAVLVHLEDCEKSESKGSERIHATCEAILADSSLKQYEMKRKPQGMCIIVNNYLFENEDLNRHGTKADVKALKDVFKDLSFDVKVCFNLDVHGMRDLAEDIAGKDHSKYDALFFTVMTHGGGDDTLLGVDGRSIRVADIISEFRVQRCKTLEGKPKVFFFEACRGSFSEAGAYGVVYGDTTPSVDSTLARGTSPQEADFLLAFGSAPSYISYLDKKYGSPFIQTLVEVIRESHHGSHLTEMLSEVTRRVVKEFSLQVPTQSNTLRAKLYLSG